MSPWSGGLLATSLVPMTFTDEQAEALGSDLSEATPLEGPGVRFEYNFVVKVCFQSGSYRPVQGDVGKMIPTQWRKGQWAMAVN